MEQVQEQKQERQEDKMVRILATDIEGKMKIYPGLTKIKGVSWGLSNAVCNILKLDKRKKIGSLSAEELKKISDFIKNPQVPSYLINRRQDFDSGSDKHLISSDLELQKDFDIKRLKKIKIYRGFRHMAGLPTRGQRTRSNFRKNRGKSVGIKKKKKVAVSGAGVKK
ncbi:MAG: 30S ribosomal protein S13 [archaeon]